MPIGGSSSGASPARDGAQLSSSSLASGSNVTRYVNLTGSAVTPGSTADALSECILIATAGTIDRLAVAPGSAYDADDTSTWTLMKNGVATALAVTIGNSATSKTAVVDSTNSVAVAVGDRIQLRSVTGATGPATATHSHSVRYTAG